MLYEHGPRVRRNRGNAFDEDAPHRDGVRGDAADERM
jgi:hypothetical protein